MSLDNDQIHNFILADITEEREAQDAKFGANREIPDISPFDPQEFREFKETAARQRCQADFAAGVGSWEVIAQEELMEACAAKTPAERRVELIQTAAVIVAWIENIDRRARA